MLALQLYIWYVDGIDMKTTLECMRIIGLNRHSQCDHDLWYG